MTTPVLRIQPAVLEDAAAIGDLPGLGASTLRLLEHDLAAPGRCCLVARVDDEVVGYAAGLLQLDVAHVLDVAVAVEHRRRGVATALVAALMERVRDDGAAAVTLEVRAGNAAGQALYRRLGFVVEGRRPRYYADGEDAVLMWWRSP